MNDLDRLLCQPLPDVADNGFSRQVMARVQAERQGLDLTAWALIAACLAIAIPFLPLRDIAVTLGQSVPDAIGIELARVGSQFATPGMAALALAALVLSFVLERQFSRS